MTDEEQSKEWVFTSEGQAYLDVAHQELLGMFEQVGRLSDGFRVDHEIPAVDVELMRKDEWRAYTLSLSGDGTHDEGINSVTGNDVTAVVEEAFGNFRSYW